MHDPRRRTFLRLAAAAGVSMSYSARAQSYPVRPITIVVPFPAGGPTDILARILADHMRTTLGQPLIVETCPVRAAVLVWAASLAQRRTATRSASAIGKR